MTLSAATSLDDAAALDTAPASLVTSALASSSSITISATSVDPAPADDASASISAASAAAAVSGCSGRGEPVILGVRDSILRWSSSHTAWPGLCR